MISESFINDLIFPSSDWITTTYDDNCVLASCSIDEAKMMTRLSTIIHSSNGHRKKVNVVPVPQEEPVMCAHTEETETGTGTGTEKSIIRVPTIPDPPVTPTTVMYDYLPVEGDALLWSCYVARHGFLEYTVARERKMVNETTEKMNVSDAVQNNAPLLKRSSEKLTRDATSALATAIITLPELKHDSLIGLALYYRLNISLVFTGISVYIEYAVDVPDVKHILLYVGSSALTNKNGVGRRRNHHHPKFWYNGEEGEDVVRGLIASREYFKIHSISKPFHFPKCRREDLLEMYENLKIDTHENFELPQKPKLDDIKGVLMEFMGHQLQKFKF